MQLSALTAPARGISHFSCHKSIFISAMTGVENYFWPRKTSVVLPLSHSLRQGICGNIFIKKAARKEVEGGWAKIANWREAKEGVIDGGEMTGRRGAEDGCGS